MTEPHRNPDLIMKLRKRTDAPLLECKKALIHSAGVQKSPRLASSEFPQ